MNEINFRINDIKEIKMTMDVGIKEIYPPIENLEITPTKEQQVFTHENSYGYDKVTVEPIPEIKLQDKEITPTKETQNITSNEDYDGLNRVIVKPIPDSYIEPSGTLEITENGTYNVREYEQATVEVEGTKETSITSVSELEESILGSMNSLLSYFKTFPDTYKTYTTDPVVLYSPVSTHTHYAIRYRGSSYQVVWFSEEVPAIQRTSTDTTKTKYVYLPQGTIKSEAKLNANIELYDFHTTAYMSSNMNTIEQCISAMQNSSTVYTTATNTGWGSYSIDGYIVPYTNMVTYDETGNAIPSQRISSNETIETI